MNKITNDDKHFLVSLLNQVKLINKDDKIKTINKQELGYLITTVRKNETNNYLIDYRVYVFDNFIDINIDYHDNYPSQITLMPLLGEKEYIILTVDGELKYFYDIDCRFTNMQEAVKKLKNKTHISEVEILVKKKKNK